MNEFDIPFNIVFDNIFDSNSVNAIPNIITISTVIVDTIDENIPVK